MYVRVYSYLFVCVAFFLCSSTSAADLSALQSTDVLDANIHLLAVLCEVCEIAQTAHNALPSPVNSHMWSHDTLLSTVSLSRDSFCSKMPKSGVEHRAVAP